MQPVAFYFLFAAEQSEGAIGNETQSPSAAVCVMAESSHRFKSLLLQFG
jgi:hypothetical protein